MKSFKKIKKGSFGYLKYQKKIEVAKTLIMLALSVALYNMGLYLTGSKQNLLTYAAILGCLPMAKFAVNVVMFTKAKSCSEELYNYIVSKGIEPTYWDLFFTDYKVNYQVSAIYYKKGCLIGITEDSNMDINNCENHIRTKLETAGYSNLTIKVFNDKDKFVNRMLELKDLPEDTKDVAFLLDNLINISL